MRECWLTDPKVSINVLIRSSFIRLILFSNVSTSVVFFFLSLAETSKFYGNPDSAEINEWRWWVSILCVRY